MNRRSIRRAIRASMRPEPSRTFEAVALPHRSPSVALGIGETFDSALALLTIDVGPQSLLIPDLRANGTPGPRLTHAVVSVLAKTSAVSIGLPNDLNRSASIRWRSLAMSANATVEILGSTEWNRVEFGDRSLILENGDFPAELFSDSTVIGLSRPTNGGSIASWTQIVHPNTALRARASGNAIVELSLAVDARYIVCGQIGSMWLVALAEPAIAAELMARGLEHLRERVRGIETIGPWEDAGVQHLCSLGEAGPETIDLVLDACLPDNASEDIARQLAEMLGMKLNISQR